VIAVSLPTLTPKTQEGAIQTRSRLEQRKGILEGALKRIDEDHREGNLPEDVHLELRSRYEEELAEVDKKLEEMGEEVLSELAELTEKKKKMLLAIKKLKSEYESGQVPQELYEELLTNYKRKAIELMKEIDKLKGNNL